MLPLGRIARQLVAPCIGISAPVADAKIVELEIREERPGAGPSVRQQRNRWWQLLHAALRVKIACPSRSCGVERLLLERLEAAIPHQLGHETDVQQRRRIAPPEPTGVGDTDPARFGEREAWVVTTGAGLCPCAGQARVKEQPRAGIDQRVARSPADILLNRKKLLEVTIAGLVLAKIAFSSSRLAERPDRKNEGSANRARHCATEHRPPEPIRRICPKY